jgi:hypothetical protein
MAPTTVLNRYCCRSPSPSPYQRYEPSRQAHAKSYNINHRAGLFDPSGCISMYQTPRQYAIIRPQPGSMYWTTSFSICSPSYQTRHALHTQYASVSVACRSVGRS